MSTLTRPSAGSTAYDGEFQFARRPWPRSFTAGRTPHFLNQGQCGPVNGVLQVHRKVRLVPLGNFSEVQRLSTVDFDQIPGFQILRSGIGAEYDAHQASFETLDLSLVGVGVFQAPDCNLLVLHRWHNWDKCSIHEAM